MCHCKIPTFPGELPLDRQAVHCGFSTLLPGERAVCAQPLQRPDRLTLRKACAVVNGLAALGCPEQIDLPAVKPEESVLCCMNRFLRLILAYGAMNLALVVSGAEPGPTPWAAVNEAINARRPQTALQLLQPMADRAIRQEAWGEAARAIHLRVQLEVEIQGNQADESVRRLTAALEQSPKPLAPILQTLLAHAYWTYFNQHRWQFLQRTATAEPPGPDFTTWDLPRLFQEIDRQFQAALAHAPELQAIPVARFDGILSPGTIPDGYRPTLYDFLAHEALGFYTAAEHAAARTSPQVELTADRPFHGTLPLFGTMEEFMLAELPAEPPEVALEEKAVRLFRELLRFHRLDADPSARLDLDLARLKWLSNAAIGEGKEELYRRALERYANDNRHHGLASKALFYLAELTHQNGDFAGAHALARRATQLHPRSPGAALASELLRQIESPELTITSEKVWTPGRLGLLPDLAVTYRNVTNVSLRIIAQPWTNHLSSPGLWEPQTRRRIMAETPVWTGSYPLPSTQDYQLRTLPLAAPTNLPPGFYLVLASPNPAFAEDRGPLAFAAVWVSDLALITRNAPGRLEGFVLDALSGDPLANAQVRVFEPDARGSGYRPTEALTTDDAGFFAAKHSATRSAFVLETTLGGRRVATLEPQGWFPNVAPPPPNDRTFLFTDRALYRPGQSIHYKGLRVRVDTEQNHYQVRAGAPVTVVFSDVNGQEIGRHTHRANDYGSFTGTFVAPKNRLLGAMALSDEAHPESRATVQVEEYKRPRFQVLLEPPRNSPRLGEAVRLEGAAISLSGQGLTAAAVRWRVSRATHHPQPVVTRRFHFPPSVDAAQEIAHGTVTTDAQGRFTLEFPARPDLRVAATNRPVFVYDVQVDVTDQTGETRSENRPVRIGYHTAVLVGQVHEWQTSQDPVLLEIKAENLEGSPQSLEGRLEIFTLQPPPKVVRPPLNPTWFDPAAGNPGSADLSSTEHWPVAAKIQEAGFQLGPEGQAEFQVRLDPGGYRAIWRSQDRLGNALETQATFVVLDPRSRRFPIRLAQKVQAPAWSVEAGETFRLLWGTGYDQGRAFIEIEHRHQIIQRFWTPADATQFLLELPTTEALRGGFTVQVTQVRENRGLLMTRHVDVPWTHKDLDLKWERFVSKLEPGRSEQWTLRIQPKSRAKDGNALSRVGVPPVELAATMYDASLDALTPHEWLRKFDVFFQDASMRYPRFLNETVGFQVAAGQWPVTGDPGLVTETYRHFRDGASGVGARRYKGEPPRPASVQLGTAVAEAADVAASPAAPPVAAVTDARTAHTGSGAGASVIPRRNLSESAFFFPQVVSDTNGVVQLRFTMPEALTEWRLLAFAHDPQLRSGFIEAKAQTAKALMVQPNPPRFIREGDHLEFRVKVSNTSTVRQQGTVQLKFRLALDNRPVDVELGNRNPQLAFDVPPQESRSFAWRLQVPDGLGFLIYETLATSAEGSDGEEGSLPVLSRKIFVTESLALPLRGAGTREFRFENLLNSHRSDTLIHQGLTVQMVSHPSWYALLSLPYLMEFPHECSEQTFNRLYANSLARHILHSNPRIQSLFEQWRGTPALLSPLQRNADLKSVLLEETPWLREAQSESESRRRLGDLFQSSRLDAEMQRLQERLKELQLSDGRWPWFPGGSGNDYITLYIATGLGRLRHLDVDVSTETAHRAWNRLDAWMTERHRRTLQHPNATKVYLDDLAALYLYGRTFFLREVPFAPADEPAWRFWLQQGKEYWTKLGHRSAQAHVALALHRTGEQITPIAILKSLHERSVSQEELGMFWREGEESWGWQEAPIETQALMIEAFDELGRDRASVENCQVWLLKQKQTQGWRSTKATADAVYALLLRGFNDLDNEVVAQVKLAGVQVERPRVQGATSPPEAGSGFTETKLAPSAIRAEQGRITATKAGPGVSWGSVTWQYLEDITKIPSQTSGPLKLKKQIFVVRQTGQGKVLNTVTEPLAVGDEVVVRLELAVDRDLEFVHLKDQRGSGLEPLNTRSQYKYQDGLGYYESTRDTATHFFLDRLPKGNYVFEYGSRVQQAGDYQSGMAEIQCMYAPEFNSHSSSLRLQVGTQP